MGSRGIVRRWRVAGSVGAAAALLTASAAFGADRVSTGSYSGTTSEDQPVTLNVASNGHAITNFKTTLGYNVVISRIEIPVSGKFSKRTTLKLLQFHVPGEVTGHASGHKVTGKVIQFLHGKPNKCYVETFTARTA